MVATSGQKSEVIDLIDPFMVCEPWKDYPISAFNTAGGLINDDIIICGGSSTYPVPNAINECYKIGPHQFEESLSLNEPTFGASSVVLGDSLFYAGGTDFKGKFNL